jgi:hypothetical protein
MNLDAAENLVYLKGHKGPHPAAYHREIFRRLSLAIEDCGTIAQCRSKLMEELRKISEEICTPESLLHGLVTKSQD